MVNGGKGILVGQDIFNKDVYIELPINNVLYINHFNHPNFEDFYKLLIGQVEVVYGGIRIHTETGIDKYVKRVKGRLMTDKGSGNGEEGTHLRVYVYDLRGEEDFNNYLGDIETKVNSISEDELIIISEPKLHDKSHLLYSKGSIIQFYHRLQTPRERIQLYKIPLPPLSQYEIYYKERQSIIPRRVSLTDIEEDKRWMKMWGVSIIGMTT